MNSKTLRTALHYLLLAALIAVGVFIVTQFSASIAGAIHQIINK